jgi:hypothetical protein
MTQFLRLQRRGRRAQIHQTFNFVLYKIQFNLEQRILLGVKGRFSRGAAAGLGRV